MQTYDEDKRAAIAAALRKLLMNQADARLIGTVTEAVVSAMFDQPPALEPDRQALLGELRRLEVSHGCHAVTVLSRRLAKGPRDRAAWQRKLRRWRKKADACPKTILETQ